MNISTKTAQTEPTGATDEQTRQIIAELTRSYWMELETVTNYLANSIHLDGVRAKEIKESLEEEVDDELGHARQLASRIHVLGGPLPGSKQFKAEQDSLQPPGNSTDVTAVIKGVIDAENSAIEQYDKIIQLTDGVDFGTQDLCIDLLRDEQAHRREFLGYLAEYEKG